MDSLLLPPSILTDSYKASHFLQYPDAKLFSAYGEFRTPFKNVESDDQRFVWYGIRYLVKHYLERKWTHQDVDRADAFYKSHNAGFTPYPYPAHLFHKFIDENNGHFPIKLEALPEGTVAHIHVPVFQITAEGEYTFLATFMETILTMVWYPSCVATLSRKVRELVDNSFDKTVDPDSFFLADSRLHDFGFRGTTSVEQSVIGGSAHLLNFRGSDTMSACYYTQFELNNGKPVAQSIPATEHSVMTSWRTEKEAIENMIDKFGSGTFACVLDSYDYDHALNVVIPSIAEKKTAKGGWMVARPDSGDPQEQVLKGLRALEKTFGCTTNHKGFKVIQGASVIQGDGMNHGMIKKLVGAVEDAGYAAQNVAYGMGGGLLQRVDRDSMGFATKLSYVEFADGTQRNVMKKPHGDWSKASFPGRLAVKRVDGIPMVFPKSEVSDEENMLRVVYDKGPVANAFPEDFDTLRARVSQQWKELPKHFDPRSPSLRVLIEQWLSEHRLD